jgi:hypothetical protein
MSNINYHPNDHTGGINNTYSIGTHNYPKNYPATGGYNTNNANNINYIDTAPTQRVIESNMYPLSGQNNANPFGNFKPVSTNTRTTMNGKWSNFDINRSSNGSTNNPLSENTAFHQNKPLINTINHKNNNHLIHNNIDENVMDEHIIEYRINIDTTDRSITAYPDPLHFKVIFNPPSSRPDKDGIVFNGPPEPHILKEFKNVKYVKLDNIILPSYSKTIDNGSGIHIVDKTATGVNLTNERYLFLSIKEINNTFTFGTNKSNEDSFAKIIPDKTIGTKFYTGTPFYGNKLFKNSHLGNITTLTIDIFDSRGNKVLIDGLDTSIENKVDARHPLFPDFQMSMSLIFGVVESQINTNTKFEQ